MRATDKRKERSRSEREDRRPMLVIEPGSLPIRAYVADLWRFRDLIAVFAKREMTLRYRQTVLGAAWVVLQPLLAGGILGFVFGRVAKLPNDGVNPYVFAFAGMLGYTAFSSCVTRTTASLVGNATLVAKIFFPRLALPLSTVVAVVIDFLIALVVVVVAQFLTGELPSWSMITLPGWLLLTLMLATGIGSFLAALAVRYRDIPQVTPVLLQLVLYASPVAYSVSAIPSNFRTLYYLNPLTTLLQGFHWATVNTPRPSAGQFAYSAGFAVVVFFGGLFAAEKMEKSFADVI